MADFSSECSSYSTYSRALVDLSGMTYEKGSNENL